MEVDNQMAALTAISSEKSLSMDDKEVSEMPHMAARQSILITNRHYVL